MSIPIRAKVIGQGEIRVFKLINGQPHGIGMTIKTMLNFHKMSRDELTGLLPIIIKCNWRVIRWLRGEEK